MSCNLSPSHFIRSVSVSVALQVARRPAIRLAINIRNRRTFFKEALGFACLLGIGPGVPHPLLFAQLRRAKSTPSSAVFLPRVQHAADHVPVHRHDGGKVAGDVSPMPTVTTTFRKHSTRRGSFLEHVRVGSDAPDNNSRFTPFSSGLCARKQRACKTRGQLGPRKTVREFSVGASHRSRLAKFGIWALSAVADGINSVLGVPGALRRRRGHRNPRSRQGTEVQSRR